MQQRRLRLGDIVDDYCPRERRVTNHAIVAMIEDDIRQTRCTTCDTEHEYKQGKLPTLRKKKDGVSAAYKEVLAVVKAEAPVPATPSSARAARDAAPVGEGDEPVQPSLLPADADVETAHVADASGDEEFGDEGGEVDAARVHRRLIRAQLPRPENHQVVRPVPEFTMRQPTARPGAKFRGGAGRGMVGGRPGAGGGGVRGGGNANGNVARGGQSFGRPGGGRGGAQVGRAAGRNDAHRQGRGSQPPRHGKKHSK
jgi:hypothetical protein